MLPRRKAILPLLIGAGLVAGGYAHVFAPAPVPAPLAAKISAAATPRPAPGRRGGTTPAVTTSAYTVRAGDSLSLIALRAYGHLDAWTLIYQANRNLITDPSQLLIGWKLTLPAYHGTVPASPLPAPAYTASQAPAASGPPVTSGSPQATAAAMMASYGWSSGQMTCLIPLWNQESGWNPLAGNASGAYGIPQALPGSKMAAAGSDWLTSPVTQIRWGLGYIRDRYGSPCGAWAHERSAGWY